MITAYSISRAVDTITVDVVSDLVGVIAYHWYVDGEWQGATATPSRTFRIPLGGAVGVECVDTTDPDFDYWLAAPIGYPADRIIAWCRSVAEGVTAYRVTQQRDAGAWEVIARVPADRRRWRYSYRATGLVSLSTYRWRIYPIGAGGVEGSPIEIGPEFFVCVPAPPAFATTFDVETSRVTFSGSGS